MAAALFWVYRIAFLYSIGYATAIHFPAWWLRLIPRNVHGIFAWSFLCHSVAVLLVTLPVAWILARFYGRLGVYLGAAAALALVIPDILSTVRYSHLMSAFGLTVATADLIKVAVALPLSVWLLLKLPSNIRWSGP
jgi:hypothetical protein